jgi:hypothetical protein
MPQRPNEYALAVLMNCTSPSGRSSYAASSSPSSLVELVTLVSGMQAQHRSVSLINCVAGTSGPSLLEWPLRTTARVH